MFDAPDLASHIAPLLAASERAPSSDFDLNTDTKPDLTYRDAAVLVPLIFEHDHWKVILTKRPATMKHHPGQVAFPGGKKDPSDADLQSTAAREACEEIGISAGSINWLGQLPKHQTITGFEVSPFVAVLETGQSLTPEQYEVEEVFTVPLAHFSRSKFRKEGRVWAGATRYYYSVPYGPYYIWGATARILLSLALVLEQTDAH